MILRGSCSIQQCKRDFIRSYSSRGQWLLARLSNHGNTATCIQFKPDSNHFALDTLQPGYVKLSYIQMGELKRDKTNQTKNIPTEYGGRRINKVRLKFR